MLSLYIPGKELYNEEINEFVNIKETTILLEHSLLAISKWESTWEKPFLSSNSKTAEEVLDYIRCMTINKNVDPIIYKLLSRNDFEEIEKYINARMTATTFRMQGASGGRKIITSEVIYYWMVAYNIPFECERWHLNRLLTLIRICSEENKPKKKMSKKEILSRNASLNAARRAALNSKG